MKIAIPVAPVGSALLALVAACLLQVLPAAAQRICGDTPVEVIVKARQKTHGEYMAPILWSSCARSVYGDQWGSLRLSAGNNGPECYYARARRSYYRSSRVIACPPGEYVRDPRWVCFYRAIPCRYPGNRGGEDDD